MARLVEELETRRLMAATDPLNPSNGSLVGQFVSRVKPALIGATVIKLGMKLTNRGKSLQEGLVDITYVLSSDAVADNRDTVLLQKLQTPVSIKAGRTTVFNETVTLPQALVAGRYTIVAALDTGGDQAKGDGFKRSVPGASLNYTPATSNVGVRTFKVSSQKLPGGTVRGKVTVTLQNFSVVNAEGLITIGLFATKKRFDFPEGDVQLSSQLVDVSLKPRQRVTVTLDYDSPSNIVDGNYIFRVSLDRSKIANDGADNNTASAWSPKTYPLHA